MFLEIVIKDIRKKDYNKAIRFAITGMHFDRYLNNQILLNAYGRYFWYLEVNRATQILAAYAGDEFVGVILAQVKGEQRKRQSFLQKSYVRIADLILGIFSKDGAGLYEATTQELLEHYLEHNSPDGEIVFLAADPDCNIKGIGTALLNALAEREKGKTLYLHTDDACTYQFYEHRGFEKAAEKDIMLEMPKGKVPLKCFIYSREM